MSDDANKPPAPKKPGVPKKTMMGMPGMFPPVGPKPTADTTEAPTREVALPARPATLAMEMPVAPPADAAPPAPAAPAAYKPKPPGGIPAPANKLASFKKDPTLVGIPKGPAMPKPAAAAMPKPAVPVAPKPPAAPPPVTAAKAPPPAPPKVAPPPPSFAAGRQWNEAGKKGTDPAVALPRRNPTLAMDTSMVQPAIDKAKAIVAERAAARENTGPTPLPARTELTSDYPTMAASAAYDAASLTAMASKSGAAALDDDDVSEATVSSSSLLEEDDFGEAATVPPVKAPPPPPAPAAGFDVDFDSPSVKPTEDIGFAGTVEIQIPKNLPPVRMAEKVQPAAVSSADPAVGDALSSLMPPATNSLPPFGASLPPTSDDLPSRGVPAWAWLAVGSFAVLAIGGAFAWKFIQPEAPAPQKPPAAAAPAAEKPAEKPAPPTDPVKADAPAAEPTKAAEPAPTAEPAKEEPAAPATAAARLDESGVTPPAPTPAIKKLSPAKRAERIRKVREQTLKALKGDHGRTAAGLAGDWLMLDADSAPAANAMAQALTLEKNFDDALHWSARAINADNTNVDYWVTRGNIFLDMKNKAEAKAAFESALAINKKNPDAVKGLAKAKKK